MGKKQVIPGQEMGMIGMKIGEVPPNAEIIFEVTLLKMK